jgi:hypothetical protein
MYTSIKKVGKAWTLVEEAREKIEMLCIRPKLMKISIYYSYGLRKRKEHISVSADILLCSKTKTYCKIGINRSPADRSLSQENKRSRHDRHVA